MSRLPVKPQNIDINLIPQDAFMASYIGKFFTWALSIGRYIVVLTELVVIMSFLSRFKLDRELTDLTGAIAVQKSIIQSYQTLPTDFTSVQSRINFLTQKQQTNTIMDSLTFLEQNLPIDVKLSKLSLESTGWSISASALSAEGMKAAIDRIVAANPQSDATLGSVKLDSQTGAIDFDLNLARKQAVTPVVAAGSSN